MFLFVSDARQHFKKNIEHNEISAENRVEQQSLFKRCCHALQLLNGENCEYEHNDSIEINKMDENASYLDMSIKKYEDFEMNKAKECGNRNEYVDVAGKSSNSDVDDNIYDDFVVEQSKLASSNNKLDVKRDCPFTGLPAAHLTIMQSPKIGWITLYQRKKRFLPNFGIHLKRKYYAGVIMENSMKNETNRHNWWLLMYNRTSDLKPSMCLYVNQFDICCCEHIPNKDESMIKRKLRITRSEDNKQTQCRFEMKDKTSTVKNESNSYCLKAESIEQCEQWCNVLKQLSRGQPYVETITATAQIRKLPMLPSPTTSSASDPIDETDNSNLKKAALYTNDSDIFNYSEGVYEEPEEFYKAPKATKAVNAPKIDKIEVPKTPAKMRIDDLSTIYDTPKTPVRAVQPNVQKIDCSSEKKTPMQCKSSNDTNLNNIEKSRERQQTKIDENSSKFTSRSKKLSQKYLSSNSPSVECSESIKSKSEKFENSRLSSSKSVTNQKNQLSNVRKWLFTNHLNKIRHSTAPSEQQNQPIRCSQPTNANTSNVNQRKVFSIQPKGQKVHMIINQLEANGQLTLLSGNVTANKYNSLLKSA